MLKAGGIILCICLIATLSFPHIVFDKLVIILIGFSPGDIVGTSSKAPRLFDIKI